MFATNRTRFSALGAFLTTEFAAIRMRASNRAGLLAWLALSAAQVFASVVTYVDFTALFLAFIMERIANALYASFCAGVAAF